MNPRDRLRGDDGPAVHRFQMREKLMSIGDDSWIENGDGERVFKVNGKAARVRDTFILEDPDGAELAKIHRRQGQRPGQDDHRVRRLHRQRAQGADRIAGPVQH